MLNFFTVLKENVYVLPVKFIVFIHGLINYIMLIYVESYLLLLLCCCQIHGHTRESVVVHMQGVLLCSSLNST